MGELIQQWAFILFPTVTVGIAQLLKFFIYSGQKGIDVRYVLSYGGMPSGHTAFFASLSTIVGLIEGFHSASFAIALMMTVIIVRDAMGLRQALGIHGKAINALAHKMKVGGSIPKVKEILGHTPNEVIVGSAVGVACSLILYWVFF